MTDRPLPMGTEFLFKLTLPTRTDPFQLRGVVVWLNHEEEMQRPEFEEMGMGIRFLFTDASERSAFEHEVEQMMVKSLGQHLYDQLIEAHKSDPSPFE